jgi:HSP20 family protein
VFEDFPFARVPRSLFNFPNGGSNGDARPAVELVERDGGYRLSVEVPGIDEKDIAVELADGVLSISGEKREESEKSEGDYLISERSYGSFRRELSLPQDADPDTIQAKVRNGVLKLDMKKDKDAVSRTRRIAIG